MTALLPVEIVGGGLAGLSLGLALLPLQRHVSKTVLGTGAVILAAAAAAMIELGQVLLPDRICDSTDFGFEIVGAFLGYLSFVAIERAFGRARAAGTVL